jgi:hypothetical protein
MFPTDQISMVFTEGVSAAVRTDHPKARDRSGLGGFGCISQLQASWWSGDQRFCK